MAAPPSVRHGAVAGFESPMSIRFWCPIDRVPKSSATPAPLAPTHRTLASMPSVVSRPPLPARRFCRPKVGFCSLAVALAALGAAVWSPSGAGAQVGGSNTSPRGTAPSTVAPTSAADVTEQLGPDEVPRHIRTPAPVIIVDDPRIAPELGAVPLESEEYDRAVAAYLGVAGRRQTASDTFDRSVTELTELLAAKARLASERNVAMRRRAKSQQRLTELREELRGVALDGYLSAGLGGAMVGFVDSEQGMVAGTRRVYLGTVHADQLAEQRLNVAVNQEMAAQLATTEAEQRFVEQRVGEVTTIRDAAAEERDRSTDELAARKREVADARLLANVIDLDFTLVVFNAYFRGARLHATEDPNCGLRWQALAGIGRTESWHGTYSGGFVNPEGDLTEPIFGIALDGSNGTAVIPDSDDGELDGDDTIDRAVGPMQFIPTTWVAFARDGNADGRADPQNYYDTNTTAAAYLCKQGPGLEADDGMRRAFRSYNNDGGYVELVLERTHGYDRYVIPSINGDPTPPLPPPLPTSSTTSTSRVRPSGSSTSTAAPTTTTATTVAPTSVTTSVPTTPTTGAPPTTGPTTNTTATPPPSPAAPPA